MAGQEGEALQAAAGTSLAAEGQARAASSAREPDVAVSADADPAAPPVQQAHADLPVCDAPEAHADPKVHNYPNLLPS